MSPRLLRLSHAVLGVIAVAGCAVTTQRVAAPLSETEPARSRPHMHANAMNYDIVAGAPVDAELQTRLVEMDRTAAAELALGDAPRSFGILDLSDLRLAVLRPDDEFYGASVPKIIIVLGYLQQLAERGEKLSPAAELELARVIRESDNDLAAKYSQLVGLDYLQSLVQTSRYRFYDRNHGGGLWCGKHYGLDAPRRGDPLLDHSHAATVRQCLRYYLLLEQGRLGSPEISAELRRIFTTRWLHLHDDDFVKGLADRDVTIIRKNGLWEDWNLDTARVQHGDRVYLLAGMIRHGKGAEYLAKMAAAVDEALCGPSKPLPYQHDLTLHDSNESFRTGTFIESRLIGNSAGVGVEMGNGAGYVGPIIEPPLKFDEMLVSWNAEVPPGAGMVIEVRAGKRLNDSWTPWLRLATWGELPPGGECVTSTDGAKIDIDYFRATQRFDRAQYRLRASVPNPAAPVVLRRVGVCCSDLTGLPDSTPRWRRPPIAVDPASWQRRLPVPWRSQKTERPEIAGRICSPTSVSMVMEYRGARQPTLAVAQTALDPLHDIYGNWPRNVQAAFSFGVPGYLTRFSDWRDVQRMIAIGQPLVISVRVAKKGDLRGAPYESTDGHLIVLCGFDADGNVEINDPAASTEEKGRVKYRREDLENVWMRATGGVAYVLTGTAP